MCLPLVLRDSCDNFFNSFEAEVADGMSVSLDLPQALPSLLLVPEIFESSNDWLFNLFCY
jgi:hypothetical protein